MPALSVFGSGPALATLTAPLKVTPLAKTTLRGGGEPVGGWGDGGERGGSCGGGDSVDGSEGGGKGGDLGGGGGEPPPPPPPPQQSIFP